jgi:uncharacterized protein involved in propanediol utilization
MTFDAAPDAGRAPGHGRRRSRRLDGAGAAPSPRLRGSAPGAPGFGAARVAGHFGEFLQGIAGPGGPVALVTLPCPALAVRAEWRAGGPFAWTSGPGAPAVARGAARAVAAGAGAARGRLRLRWDMPPGGGAGASTAALVAAARAAAAGAGRAAPDSAALAVLCLRIEGACDPTMHDAPATLLWASRMGRRLASLPPPPAFEVAGGFDGPPRRTDPADARFADAADLIAAWAAAGARGDPAAAAAVATESARRNAALRGGPPLSPLLAAAEETGALGLAAAHTGSARALLYAPGRGDPAAGLARLRALGLTGTLRFRTPA